jgi:hypothetical protein
MAINKVSVGRKSVKLVLVKSVCGKVANLSIKLVGSVKKPLSPTKPKKKKKKKKKIISPTIHHLIDVS